MDELLDEITKASKALHLCMEKTNLHLVMLIREHEQLRQQEIDAMRRIGRAFDAMSERAQRMESYAREVIEAVKTNNPSLDN